MTDLVPTSAPGALLQAHCLKGPALSPATREAYTRDLGLFLRYLEGAGVAPQAATFVHIEGFRDALADGSFDGCARKPRSVNRALSAVKRAYREICLRVPGWDHNPARDVAGVRDSYRANPNVPTVAQVRRLLSAASMLPGELREFRRGSTATLYIRDQCVFLLMGACGLRREEVVSLRFPDCLVPAGDGFTLDFTRKGGGEGLVGMGTLSVRCVRIWIARRRGPTPGPLFPGRGGRKLDVSSVNKRLQVRCEAAGIKPIIEPHGLRRFFVTQALEAGVDQRLVQYAAGHADPRTTQGYDDARRAAQSEPSTAVEAALTERTP